MRAGTRVTFECSATTDPDELSKLTIKWLHNGKVINLSTEAHIHKNVENNSLTITTIVNDTGRYTCVANNTLDVATAYADLVVQGMT